MARDQKPNLLLIMADQHRHDWFGAAGATWTRTPHIDSIAARGLRFTQCACNSPVCAPSRISLASGLQPHRVGALDNSAFLKLTTPTYYQALRDHGYRVGFVGKIDLHKPDPYNGRNGDRPITYAYGFTDPIECEGKMHAGQGPLPNGPYNHYLVERGKFELFCTDYHRRGHGLPVWYAADSVLETDEWEDCYISRRACELLERFPDESPWHLFVSFVGPHDPWDPPTEYAEHFRRTPMPEPLADSLEGKPRWQHTKAKKQSGATAEEVANVRRQYTAALELIDRQIGQILAALDRRGQRDNTYIVYCSDHGEMLGDHGFFQKSIHYEAALRVPLIVAGPGITPGQTPALVELSDVHPTLLELAGIAPSPGLDARAFVPVLHDPLQEHRTDTVSQLLHCRSLRNNEWKLVENHNDLPELYHLRDDPNELINLAPSHADVVARMHRRLVQRLL
ncbi:MAG: sulfatase-like hydrolase/transferase [Chloroflexi bacterium]|nr:sulfatase-like hydrolase/transferase [Chloroflexota bacterium]